MLESLFSHPTGASFDGIDISCDNIQKYQEFCCSFVAFALYLIMILK